MTRRQYIEMIRRQIYGGQPSDDASITVNLVNKWLNFGVAAAARQSYVDTMKMEGIAYINNSFYTTFKNLTVSKDETFLWKIELPQIPLGIGSNVAKHEPISFSQGNERNTKQVIGIFGRTVCVCKKHYTVKPIHSISDND